MDRSDDSQVWIGHVMTVCAATQERWSLSTPMIAVARVVTDAKDPGHLGVGKLLATPLQWDVFATMSVLPWLLSCLRPDHRASSQSPA
jgi:hypothetical protein